MLRLLEAVPKAKIETSSLAAFQDARQYIAKSFNHWDYKAMLISTSHQDYLEIQQTNLYQLAKRYVIHIING